MAHKDLKKALKQGRLVKQGGSYFWAQKGVITPSATAMTHDEVMRMLMTRPTCGNKRPRRKGRSRKGRR